MTITIKIETGNAAFRDDDYPENAEADKLWEVYRILGVVRQRIGDGEREGRTQDINGNIVGSFIVRGK